MKRQILAGAKIEGRFFELTIRINGQKEQTFVFQNEDDVVIEQTNNWFIVYFNKKVIISIKLTVLDYMYTGWRFI